MIAEFVAVLALLFVGFYAVEKAGERFSLPKIARSAIIVCLVTITWIAAVGVVRASNKRQCDEDPKRGWRDLGALSMGRCGDY